MESIRGALPESLVKAMFRKLGREEALRLLWPALVGEKLGAQTRLSRMRGTTLVIAVPDPQWVRALAPLSKMILEAVNGATGTWQATAAEFVSDPQEFPTDFAARNRGHAVGLGKSVAAGSTEGLPWKEAFRVSERKYFAGAEGAEK